MTEAQEQELLSETLDIMRIQHYSLRNEESIKNMGYLMKRKRMGWKSGVSDLMILIPAERSSVKRALILFVELKKSKKKLLRASSRGEVGDLVSQNKATAPQMEFIRQINEVKDVQGFVCHGADHALEFINSFLN